MIELRGVTLNYRTAEGHARRALADVTLAIPERQFVCVLGPSGCGKTSLLNLVAGFMPPTEGEVFFDGAPVTAPGPDRGVVFQDPTLFPWLTVWSNVAFGLRRAGCERPEIEARTADALALVGLTGHEDAYPHALSGGMRQRASIARVLVMNPRALLMDEPFSALDANARERLQDELIRIWERERRTILYVTHSVEEAVYLGDRVIVMGPAPDNVVCDTTLRMPHPRERTGPALHDAKRELREKLNALPCCITNEQQQERHKA